MTTIWHVNAFHVTGPANNNETNGLPTFQLPLDIVCLTSKHRETHACVVSTVVTDALVLKHQAISIHNANQTLIVLDQFHIKNIAHTRLENKITLWKKWPSRLRVNGCYAICVTWLMWHNRNFGSTCLNMERYLNQKTNPRITSTRIFCPAK